MQCVLDFLFPWQLKTWAHVKVYKTMQYKKTLVSWIMKLLTPCFSSHLMWAVDVEKQRNKLCFTFCDHVPFSKGKKNTTQYLHLSPGYPQSFSLFFSCCCYSQWNLSSWNSTGEKLSASLHPAVTAQGQCVWAALEANLENPAASEELCVSPHTWLGPQLTVLTLQWDWWCGFWETLGTKLIDTAVP